MSPTPRISLPLALSALLGLLVLLAGSSRPAAAVDAAAPTPCTGAPLATDPEGDAIIPGGLTGSEAPGQPNMDITAFWFNYRPDSGGKPVLTANIQVKNLDKNVPDPYLLSGGIYYYVHWNVGDEYRFVRAANDGSAVTYGYGTVDDVGAYTTAGETAGNFFEGPKGVVQIDIPEAHSGKPGDVLEKPVAVVDTIEGFDDVLGLNNHGDGAGQAEGDDPGVNPANGVVDYKVTPCPAGAAPPASGGGGTTPPAATPPGGGTSSPPAAGPTALPLKVPTSLGSAKKAKRKKAISLKVTASEVITKLSIKIVPRNKKSPVVAKATIATLKQGTSTIKLKPGKRLKAGAYALIAEGTASGKRLGLVQKVTVKK